MSRYNGSNNGSNGSNNNGDFEDDTTLKLQQYAALRLEATGLNASSHQNYGASFIVNFEGTEVIDGIVFQRDDKPGTWKVFSAGKFFNLNPEDGLVYENFDQESGYSGQMSAQDILDHPRVAGFSETFGGNDYFYTPVGVVVEEAGEIATNDDLEVETTDEPAIDVGDSSMLLSNKSWTRTLAKLVSAEGDGIINDNEADNRDDNPKYDAHEWLTTDSPTLREELEGRTLELWLTEDTIDTDDGEIDFTSPNLMDTKTGNFVQIDNGIGGGSDADAGDSSDKAAATDGGTTTESPTSSSSTESADTTDSPSNGDSDSAGLPEDVPEKLDDLIDYMARNGNTDPDEIREFAEDEVEDADSIDWQAASVEAEQRAE